MKRAILQFSSELLLNFCKGEEHHFKAIENVLPKDAKYIMAFESNPRSFNGEMRCGIINIVCESEAFEDIQIGKLMPILGIPVIKGL